MIIMKDIEKVIEIDRKMGLVALSLVLVDMEVVLETWLPEEFDWSLGVGVEVDPAA